MSSRFQALVKRASRGRLPAATYYSRAGGLTVQVAERALRSVQEVGALDRPPDPRVAEYLALSRSSARLLGVEGQALRRGNIRAAARFTARAAALARRSHRLALKIGFHACGGLDR
jgi:hypothetical protein